MDGNKAMENLKAWWDATTKAFDHSVRVFNAFEMGLWYGQDDGLARIPARDKDANGDIADDIQLNAFNNGVQFHDEWVEAEPMIRAELMKALGALLAGVLAGAAARHG